MCNYDFSSNRGGEDTSTYGMAFDRELLEDCGALERREGESQIDLDDDRDYY